MKKENFSQALITGATSGIGLELAHLLADKKIPLILTGRREEALKELASTLSSKVSVTFIPADLQYKKERAKLIALIDEKKPELVINNAGLGFYSNAMQGPIEDELLILEVNCVAVVELTHASVRALIREGKEGVVVNISSIASKMPCPGMATYGASKAFVTSFSRALDYELSPYGIRVLASLPGQVDTSFGSKAAKKKQIMRRGPSIPAQKAAWYIWHQIEKGKGYFVFGYQSKLLLFLIGLLPETFISKTIYHSIQKRKQ